MVSSGFIKRNWKFLCALSGVALASLVLRWLIPPVAIYGSPHDDALMVQLAYQILNTGWIHSWADAGTNTLAKGIGYPLYLAFSSRLFPWSPLVTNQLLLLMGGLVALRELRKLGISRMACLVSFAFLAFFPVWFAAPASRIYRDGFLIVIVLLAIAASVVLRRFLVALSRGTLSWRPVVGASLSGLAGGLILGYFSITKLGWQPLAVAMAIIVLSGLVEMTKVFSLRVASIFLAGFLVVSVTTAGLVAFVSARNDRALGVALVEDFGSGAFAQAVTTMMSVQDPARPEYIDVSNTTMSELYNVSPTLQRLQPFMESSGWEKTECKQLGICGEGPGLWLTWSLREASERAGLATSAADFQETFSKIASEITSACESGRLTCGSPGIAPQLRAIGSLSPRLVIDAVGYGINHVLTLSSATPAEGNFPVYDAAVWNTVVHGLANPASTARAYNPDGTYLKGVTSALETLYRGVWILLLVVATIGAIVPLRVARTERTVRVRARVLRWLAVAGIAGTAVVIVQLALLEADGGLMMIANGSLYLLPAYPLVLLFLAAGFARLGIWVRSRFARFGRQVGMDS